MQPPASCSRSDSPARWDLGRIPGQSARRPRVSQQAAASTQLADIYRSYLAPTTTSQVGVVAEPGMDSALWRVRESFMEGMSKLRPGEE